jgi:hypothetical protein
MQISLLGFIEKEGSKKPPELLYAVTGAQPKAEILNQIQFAACVLSESRNIFFGLVLSILRVFDERRCQIIYCGE